MPQRKSNEKDRTPAATLRRSPRFLQIVLVDPENPITPNPEPQRRTRVPSSATPLTLTGKRKVSPRKRNRKSKSKECSQKLDESTILNRCVDECNAAKSSSSSNPRYRELKKRVTLSSCCKDVDKNADTFNTLAFHNDDTNERVLSITEKQVLDEKLSQKNVDKSTNAVPVTTAIVVHEGPISTSNNNKIRKNIGVKRTRNQFENTAGLTKGWTKDQESALEKAYIEAKPTPHFWKKVSKLVPGKSAQECFDKIHSSHLTPPQPRTRSRSRVSNSQNPSFSASKLLNSSSPTVKKPRYRKQKSHVIQRNVRHMLQNQYKSEQDSNADLFSVLEPTFNRSANCNLTLTTPDRNPDDVFKKCRERSSTMNKKSVSRFSSLYGSTSLVSPPVLKQVKNKALHEKYIDQLNCREAKRKAGKLHQNKEMKYENSVERKNAIKDAKNALVFGARDAINEFQHQNARVLSSLFDDESDADVDVDADKDNGQVFL